MYELGGVVHLGMSTCVAACRSNEIGSPAKSDYDAPNMNILLPSMTAEWW